MGKRDDRTLWLDRDAEERLQDISARHSEELDYSPCGKCGGWLMLADDDGVSTFCVICGWRRYKTGR